MTNCSGSLLWPNTIPCGAYGSCVDGRCSCNSGFTNKGDFSIFEDSSCDLNITAITILWALTVTQAILNFGTAAWGLWSSRRRLQFHAWRGWSMSLFSVLLSVILIFMAVLKFISISEFSIGNDVLFTILHGLFIAFSGAHLFTAFLGYMRAYELSKITRFGPEQKARIHSRMQNLYYMVYALYVVLLPVSFFPLILFSWPNYLQLIVAFHGVPIGVLFLVLGAYLAPNIMRSVSKAIEFSTRVEVSKNPTLQRIAYKLDVAKIIASIGFPCATFLIVFFAFWPYITQKASYLLPPLYGLSLIATSLAMWVGITNDENNIKRPSFPFVTRILKNDSPDALALRKAGVEPLADVPSRVQEDFSHVDEGMTPQLGETQYDGQFTEVSRGDVVQRMAYSKDADEVPI